MKNATIWIENNPSTGDVKPWEVWWQAEGHSKHRNSSSKTEDGAKKAMAKVIARTQKYYNITAA